MERELYSDELEQIQEAFMEASLLNFRNGLEKALEGEITDESIETLRRIRNKMQQAIHNIAYRHYVEGYALALIHMGRLDVIARHPDLEKAAAVIIAERMNRKGDNDA